MEIGGITCNFARAFECVNHTVLLAKLYYYSIRGLNAYWTESCPVNRKQKIILQNQKKK